MNDKERKKLIRWYMKGNRWKQRHLKMLVEAHKNLVYKIAKRYDGIADFDDLAQEGFIGLINGIKTFKSSKNKGEVAAFTHLTHRVEGYIRTYIKKNNPCIKIKSEGDVEVRHLNKSMKRCVRVEVRHFEKVNRIPRTVLISDNFNDDGDKNENFFDGVEAPEDTDFDIEQKRVLLRKFVSELKPHEQEVYRLRFIEGKTLDEVGKNFKLTRERIRQIEEKIEHKLKAKKAMFDIKRGK